MAKHAKRPKGAANKLTVILAVCASVLLVLLIAMILLLPRNEEPAPTEPTTEPTTVTTEVPTETEETEPEETKPEMLAHMAELYAQNPDIVGWIRIDGSRLDYPVMYTPDDEERYIHADFEGNFHPSGLPFIDKDCSMDPESQALVIYGHNMQNGTAFKALFNYERKEYLKNHPTISFTTLYEERTYEIMAMFYDEVYLQTDTCFKFYEFIDPETEEEYQKGIDYFKEHSMYDTGVTAEYGDRLITLVTCAYRKPNSRFVVVAREVTEDTEIAEIAE